MKGAGVRVLLGVGTGALSMPFPSSFVAKISKFPSLRSNNLYFSPAPQVLLSLDVTPILSSETVNFFGYDLVKKVPECYVLDTNSWSFWHHHFFHSTFLVWGRGQGAWGGGWAWGEWVMGHGA